MSLLQLLIVSLAVIALAETQDGQCSGQPGAVSCPWVDYCRHTIESGAVCVDGYCQCPNSNEYDPCTCLPSIGSCTIQLDAASPVGVPSSSSSSSGDDETYSCVSYANCDYDVHVLSCYEAMNRGFRQHPTGHSTVDITAVGQSSKPLVLVLVSYEAIAWELNVPSHVVIDTVIVIGYYTSSVSYSSGRVLTVESPSPGEIPRGFGEDSGGGDTVGLLQYLFNRFGHVSSFSGTYRADRWSVTINHQLEEACGVYTLPPPTTFPPYTLPPPTTFPSFPQPRPSTLPPPTTFPSFPRPRPSTLPPPAAPVTVQTNPETANNQAISCGGNSYCRATVESGAVCVDGYCQCPRSNVYDSCSCLPSIGSCTIQLDAASPVGVPSSSSASSGDDETYSCVSYANCNYDVHVLSCYEAINGGFRQHPTGRSTVDITAVGQSAKPLVLVLVSYEAIAWELNIPSQVVIDTVIVIGYYTSSVSYSSGRVLTVESPSRGEIPRGYGEDSGGGDTVGLLQYLQDRFGDAASFSATYRADSWRVDLILQEGCDPSFTTSVSSCSAPTSLSPGAIGGIITAATIAFIAIVFFVVVYAYRARRSQARTAHPSAQMLNQIPYPRQQGVIYHTGQPRTTYVHPHLISGSAAYTPQPVSAGAILSSSELLADAPPAYPATQCTLVRSGNDQSAKYGEPPPPYPGTDEHID